MPTEAPDELGTGCTVTTPLVVILPIWWAENSVNQRLPSGPVLIATGPPGSGPVGTGVRPTYSVKEPLVVTLPILLAEEENSVNQSLPSGPAVIPDGPLFAVGTVYSIMWPSLVIVAILLADFSVNHILPSGPTVMLSGILFVVGTGYSKNFEAPNTGWATSVSSSINPSIALAVNEDVFLVSLIADNFRITIGHK